MTDAPNQAEERILEFLLEERTREAKEALQKLLAEIKQQKPSRATNGPNQTAFVTAFDVRGALRACEPHRMDDPSWCQMVARWLNDCITQRITGAMAASSATHWHLMPQPPKDQE